MNRTLSRGQAETVFSAVKNLLCAWHCFSDHKGEIENCAAPCCIQGVEALAILGVDLHDSSERKDTV